MVTNNNVICENGVPKKINRRQSSTLHACPTAFENITKMVVKKIAVNETKMPRKENENNDTVKNNSTDIDDMVLDYEASSI